MKKILVRKHTDFDIKIDREFNIIFLDKLNLDVKEYSFPIVLNDNVTLNIEETYYNIINFMNNKVEFLEGEDVDTFLRLVDLEITPFIWLLMKTASIDVYFNKNNLYVVDFDTEKYIVFNNKNMSIKIFDKIYKNQIKNLDSIYSSCKEELYVFVREKIQNGIGHNEFINVQMKDFKSTQNDIEKEFLKSQQFDIKKALFLYENLIRIKENFLDEKHDLIPEHIIFEIAQTIQQIRLLLNNKPNYETKQIY